MPSVSKKSRKAAQVEAKPGRAAKRASSSRRASSKWRWKFSRQSESSRRKGSGASRVVEGGMGNVTARLQERRAR